MNVGVQKSEASQPFQNLLAFWASWGQIKESGLLKILGFLVC